MWTESCLKSAMAQTDSPSTNDDQIRRRIEELKQRIRDVTGERPVFGTMPGCPLELEKAFLEQVLAFHIAERGRRN